MDTGISDIDHLMLAVENSTRAGEVFSKMGFTITPPGELPGLSNRLICFDGLHHNAPNFVELMSLDDASLAPPSMAKALKIPNRAVLMVTATDNAAITAKQLGEAGMEVSPVIEGRRNWTLDSGEVIDLAFSIVLPAVGQAPYYWIACQHKTPQHYLREDFTRHKNHAFALKTIIAVASDPQNAAKHFEQFWTANLSGNEPVVVTCGLVQLHIHSRESFQNTYGGIELQRQDDHIVGFVTTTRELGSLGKTLEENGFTPQVTNSMIILDPSQACGCLVVFEPAGN